MVEVVADEIGPSLRWATAQVDRNDRREGAGSGGGQSFGGQGGGGSSAGRPQPEDASAEEPF